MEPGIPEPPLGAVVRNTAGQHWRHVSEGGLGPWVTCSPAGLVDSNEWGTWEDVTARGPLSITSGGPQETATGARADEYAREAREAHERLNQALSAAGLPFHLSAFRVVDDRGYPTFSVEMTAPQADRLAETLHEMSSRRPVVHHREPAPRRGRAPRMPYTEPPTDREDPEVYIP